MEELFNELQLSGDLYPYYDYAHGFGVPRATYFFDELKRDSLPSIQSVWDDLLQTVTFEELNTTEVIQKGIKAFNERGKMAFLHIENEEGFLDEYRVFLPENGIAAALNYVDCIDCKIRVFYKNFILETTKRELIKKKEAKDE